MDTLKAEQICESLQGTCKATYEVAEEFGVDEQEVLDAVVDVGTVERCTGCEWWCEMCELEIVDDEYRH